jgi:flagellar motor switch protein FliG
MNTPVKPQGANGRGGLATIPAGGSESRIGSISRAQRAAVVIAMMGEAAAKPIVDKLDDRAMEQVSAELRRIQYLDREELAEIVIDFLQHLHQQNGSFRGGPVKAREIIAGLLDDNRFGSIFGDAVAAPVVDDSRDDTWSRLEKEDPKKTAEYLNGLTSNIIAIILRNLDVSVASEIVAHLDDEKLDPTIGSLVETDQVDAEVDSVVSRMVSIEFLNNPQEAGADADDSHLEAVGELLSLVPADRRERMMAFLKSQYEGKLESIERQMFTIESLADILPRNAVSVVFRELDEQTMVQLLATLKGDSASVQEYLLGNISSRLADTYRDQLGDVKPTSPEEAETIQREFLTSLMGLKRRGLIELGKS